MVRIQRILPVSISNASTASLEGCSGSLYVLPVAAYTSPRLVSIAGAFPRRDGHSRSRAALRAEHPINATRLGSERIHTSVVTPDEHPAARDRRLRPRHGRVRKSEGPLQF